MSPVNSTLQYSETALVQRGTADINAAAAIPASKLATRESKDTYRFPGATPERQRVRRTVSNVTGAANADTIRQQQIASAKENAYSQFKRRDLELTPQEVSAYAQWILQADTVIESMRLAAERGE